MITILILTIASLIFAFGVMGALTIVAIAVIMTAIHPQTIADVKGILEFRKLESA